MSCRLDVALRKMLGTSSYAKAAQNISRVMRASRWTPAEKGASERLRLLLSGHWHSCICSSCSPAVRGLLVASLCALNSRQQAAKIALANTVRVQGCCSQRLSAVSMRLSTAMLQA